MEVLNTIADSMCLNLDAAPWWKYLCQQTSQLRLPTGLNSVCLRNAAKPKEADL